MGHEGENSLLSLLIDEGLATSIYAFNTDTMELFSFIGVKIELTEQGLENYEKVLQLIFKYIEIIKKKGVQEWIFNE